MVNNSEPIRIQKYIATLGIMSRRAVEEQIKLGKVLVNGKPAIIGQRVSDDDKIEIDHKLIKLDKKEFFVYMLNKPGDTISTMENIPGEKTLAQYTSEIPSRFFPIGRLDRTTTGLLLLTNNGDLAYRLTHPKYEIEKEYIVSVHAPLQAKDCDRLITGFMQGEDFLKADSINQIKHKTYSLVVHEGKYHEVKRLLKGVGKEVTSLERVRVGKLKMGDLAVGALRKLSSEDITLLQQKSAEGL